MGRTVGTLLTAIAAALVAVPMATAEDAPTYGKSVEEIFKGKVVKFTKKGEIELFYDFEDEVQLADFEISCPFRAIVTAERSIDRGGVRLKGTGSLRHKAVFSDWVAAELTMTPMKAQDFGLAVSEEHQSEIFTLYCCYDRYFGLGDNVTVPQNMIIKFIARDPKINRDGFQDWRYCGSRGQKPVIKRNKPHAVSIRREGIESQMRINDWKSGGKEWGRELTSQMFALYTYKSDVRGDDLTISGVLSDAFLEKHEIDRAKLIVPPKRGKAAPTDEEPVAEPEIAPDEAERIRARIAGYPRETKPLKLAKMLRDPEIPMALRQEAVQRAVGFGSKKIVPYLVDGLYDPDVTARRLTFEAVQGLLGKTFGYRPDAPEAARGKAIKKLNDYIKKRQKDFQ